MKTIDFRVDVLRGGVPYEKMVYTQPPTIYANYNAAIKMTMRGTFLHHEKIDYLNDELRPVMMVDGVDHPLGIYRIMTCGDSRSAAGIHYDEIEAYDRASRLTEAKTETWDYWAAGTAYDTIISHYLTLAGIKHVAFIPSNAVLQSSREDWDIGTDYLTIINTLLDEINYQSLWFDNSGVAQIQPYYAPSANAIQHTYSANSGLKSLRPAYTSEIDLYGKPNVFIAILDSPEYETPLVATAENDTPASRLSTISRGIRIPEVYKVDHIASVEGLQDYVNKIRDESMQTSEYVNIETALMPAHGIGDVVAVAHSDMQGVFREVEWTLPMQVGQYMTHKLQRVVMI